MRSDSAKLTVLIFCLSSRFDVKIAAAVAEETKLPFVTAENKFEALVSTNKCCLLHLVEVPSSDICIRSSDIAALCNLVYVRRPMMLLWKLVEP